MFQKIVLIIAVIVLIIALVVISFALSNSSDNQVWPPLVPSCPDYWIMDGSGNNTICTNIKNLGTCSPQSGNAPAIKDHLTMNFNGSTYTGSNGLCAKYNWANTCGLSWDGITYGVPNPCSST